MCNDAILSTIFKHETLEKKLHTNGCKKDTNFPKVQVKFTWGGWRQAHFECVSVNNTSTE